jgi:hypothetical protein
MLEIEVVKMVRSLFGHSGGWRKIVGDYLQRIIVVFVWEVVLVDASRLGSESRAHSNP